jgi:serine/threonine-protein kinase RsbW
MGQPRQLIVPGEFEHLTEIAAFITAVAREAGLNDDEVFHVEMAVDEACSNIIEHAYATQSGAINVSCSSSDAGQLQVVIRDTGKPFDPEEVPPPQMDVPPNLETLNEGGLGLYFMRKLMDEVRFEFVPGQGNILTMIKRAKTD